MFFFKENDLRTKFDSKPIEKYKASLIFYYMFIIFQFVWKLFDAI